MVSLSIEDFFATTRHFLFYDRLNPYRQFLEPVHRRSSLLLGQLQRTLVFSSLLYAICGQVTEMYLGYSRTGNIVQVTESLAWVIVAVISLDICVTFHSKSAAILDVLSSLRRLFPQGGGGGGEEQAKDLQLNLLLDPLVFIMTVFQRCYKTTLAFKILVPLAQALVRLLRAGEWEFQLPLHIWFPFDPQHLLVLPLVYAFEGWAAFLSTGPMVVMTALIGGITSVLCVQLKVLGHSFRSFGGNKSPAEDLREFVGLVQRHRELISLSEDSKAVFSSFLLRNYVLCSTGLSVFMFVAVTSDNTEVVVEYVGDVVCFNFYIATMSFFGNRLIEHVSAGGGGVS